jgi:hypothetical protein
MEYKALTRRMAVRPLVRRTGYYLIKIKQLFRSDVMPLLSGPCDGLYQAGQ